MAGALNIKYFRSRYMNGIGRWMHRNQRREYRSAFDLINPKGRLSASVKAVSAPRITTSLNDTSSFSPKVRQIIPEKQPACDKLLRHFARRRYAPARAVENDILSENCTKGVLRGKRQQA
jgi:hypothetical protein